MTSSIRISTVRRAARPWTSTAAAVLSIAATSLALGGDPPRSGPVPVADAPAPVLAASVPATPDYWTDVSAEQVARELSRAARMAGGAARPLPLRFRAGRAHIPTLRAALAGAPHEVAAAPRDSRAVIALPMPDGAVQRFSYVESPIMAPELQARYPEIRTYVGQGIDDPAASVRFDVTPAGFHAQVLSPGGTAYIEPLERGETALVASFFRRDAVRTQGFECETPSDAPLNPELAAAIRAAARADDHAHAAAAEVARPQRDGPRYSLGSTLRTYRLACAATGEYTAFHGGTVPLGLAAVVTAINRVTGVYEAELAIRLQLVAGNDAIIYTDSGSDPYTNNSGSTMLGQNQSNLDLVIGDAEYDVGHVFSTGGGGIASLAVVCVSGVKARGVTGLVNPFGDWFYIDYVAHEIGHQFGARHSFNGSGGACASNRTASSAFEPGSGSTIMSYTGLCGLDNLQLDSDAYFHSTSFDEIRAVMTYGVDCSAHTATGNLPPLVDAGTNYAIPRSTPYKLSASSTDPDNDPVTYCWEQRDLGPQAALTATDDGKIPLFRSIAPSAASFRYVPNMPMVISGLGSSSEKLPTQNRVLDVRVTARDGRAGGGGVAFDTMSIQVVAAAGPFALTSPNGGQIWGGSGTVTWNAAGTTAAPISAAAVDILLSIDGGLTWPFVLEAGTPNDGAQAVTLPVLGGLPINTARIMIRATDNIFYDISNGNFTVSQSGPLTISLMSGAPSGAAPATPTEFDLLVVGGAQSVVPGSPTLHYRWTPASAFIAVPLSALGGDLYRATLPPFNCDDAPQYYVSAAGSGGATVTEPSDAPATLHALTIGANATPLADSFESDLGWFATESPDGGDPFDGGWQRGVPVDHGRGDPFADADGSGQCWVTDNDDIDTNSDVDGGSAILTSPPLDLAGGALLSYAYWFNDHPTGLLSGDSMTVEAATDTGGTNWQLVRTYTDASSSWRHDLIVVGSEIAASESVRLRFTISDAGSQNIVEGGLDDVRATRFGCSGPATCVPGDMTRDGVVDADDIQRFIDILTNGGGTMAEICAGDLDPGRDGQVSALDVEGFSACVLAGGCE